MYECLKDNFENGMKCLEDIQYLTDGSLSPIVTRAFFHFTEMIREFKDFQMGSETPAVLNQFLRQSIRKNVQEFLLKRTDIRQINISWKSSSLNVNQWNKILEVFPLLIQTVGYFQYEDFLEISVGEKCIYVDGVPSNMEKMIDSRMNCYAVLRQCFEKKALLTYKIVSKTNDARPVFRLILDYSNGSDEIYSIERLGPNGDVSFALSNLSDQYLVKISDLATVDEHVCFAITSDLQLKLFKKIPDNLEQVLGCRDSQQPQVFHFSFLFRPVSIIIPDRGKRQLRYEIPISGDTGSARTQASEQEVIQKAVRIIDLFSLLAG